MNSELELELAEALASVKKVVKDVGVYANQHSVICRGKEILFQETYDYDGKTRSYSKFWRPYTRHTKWQAYRDCGTLEAAIKRYLRNTKKRKQNDRHRSRA